MCLVPRRKCHLLRKATALALLWWVFLMLINRMKNTEATQISWRCKPLPDETLCCLRGTWVDVCKEILWKHKWTWPCPYLWTCKMVSAGNFLTFPFMCQIKTETNQIKQHALKAWLTAVQTVNLSHGRKKTIKQSVFLQPYNCCITWCDTHFPTVYTLKLTSVKLWLKIPNGCKYLSLRWVPLLHWWPQENNQGSICPFM